MPPTPPLRWPPLREVFPWSGCRPASTACALASVTRDTVAGRIPMRNFLLTTCVGAVAVFAMGAAHANDELIKMSQNPKDWVMPTGNYANHRYSQLKQITAANVGKLQVAWTFSTGVLRGHEGGPLVIGNVMYVHGPFPNPVYALDLNNDAKILWKYEPKQDPNVIPVMCCDTVNRGVAYADGKIFLHQADTTLVALNAKTGKLVWSVKNGDPSKGETGTSSPMIFKDKVIVGISGGEFGVRWSMTIFARDVDTGMARCVYQMTPHDEWDYDGVNEMILSDQQVGGQARKLLTHFDRNGLGYSLDRATGELLIADKYDPKVNWTSGVDMNKSSPTYGRPTVVDQYSTDKQGEDHNVKGICPAALGTKDEQPAAYSPDTQLFYVPTNHVCMDYEPFKVSYTAGQPYVGATLSMYPPQGDTHMGNFIAWDAKTGKIVWSDKEQFSVWSGALATAGNVVFYGTLEGYLKAVDAKTGKELYKFKTPSGIIGNVTTYEHGGKQYVAILSGVGGWAGIGLAAGLTDPTAGLGAVGGYAALKNYTSLGGQLTVFALGTAPNPARAGTPKGSTRR